MSKRQLGLMAILAVVTAAFLGLGSGCSLLQDSGRADCDTISVQQLPAEARQMLELIGNEGPFPYAKDGAVFHNYEGLLPERPDGYYREYTVPTPGVTSRGARRIVAGKDGERYYTDDHYASFRLVME